MLDSGRVERQQIPHAEKLTLEKIVVVIVPRHFLPGVYASRILKDARTAVYCSNPEPRRKLGEFFAMPTVVAVPLESQSSGRAPL